MNHRKEILDLALRRMYGFTLEKSNDSDNRSIFNLLKILIDSAHGDTLADCRKPLIATLKAKGNNGKFNGCKITLLNQTISQLFANGKDMLSNKDFARYNRGKLLEYLEVCRRIFMSKYVARIAVEKTHEKPSMPVQQYETSMQRAFRLANERKNTKDQKNDKMV